MKKLLWILVWSLAIACGGGSATSEETEAPADEDVEIGAGEEISPQLEMDADSSRFEVDTISSSEEAREEAEADDFSDDPE